ncbi:MAG: ATP-dependent helicase, partial [Bacteroidetes bacterium]
MIEDDEAGFSLGFLNAEQKEAVLNEDKRLLILAGAGSGKTKTIIQKIIHLVFERNVDPSSILAITFTKNAKNEMIDRLILFSDKDGSYKRIFYDKLLPQKTKDYYRFEYVKKYPWLNNLNIRTFHSLSYNLLRKYGSGEFDNKFKLIDDKLYDDEINSGVKAPETQKEIFHKIIKESCEDSEYLIKLKRYILDYYVDDLRRNTSFKESKNYEKLYTTLRGDKVRSKSERYIADWLYIHEVDYTYEPILEIKDFKFRPDFYIPQADTYLEHISDLSKIKEKEKQFSIGGKPLVKTYENDVKDIRLFYENLDE